MTDPSIPFPREEPLPSILVVDDEIDNFDVIDALLCQENYQLHYASGGQEALDLLGTFKPDVILLDVMMPNMSGLDFCRLLKQDSQWRNLPIIMVTSLNSKQDLARCLEAGADDFIAKPVNSAELRARLKSMLRIKQQYDNLQGLLQLREDMVKMIIHDLRNPLSIIILAAEILRSPNLPPENQQRKLDQILTYSYELKDLIDDLLLMAKLELGKLTLHRQTVDLVDFCHTALAGMDDIARQKHLTLASEFPPPGSYPIHVDPSIFRRVLDNLLSNAIKFSPDKSQITLTATYSPEGHFQVAIADLGPGIAPELRQKIFEKYEVGSLVTGVNQIGLGLTFCKIAVETHNGTISVTDHDPRGSIFQIDMPTALP